MWPTCLQLEILDIGICTVDIQTWVHKNHAPVVRIKSVPGMDVGDFDELVKSLRNRGAVSPKRIPASLPPHGLNSVRLRGGISEAIARCGFSSRRFARTCSVRHFP